MISLSHLYIHPVKSMRGIALSRAQVSISGLASDRIFMLTTSDGKFITARQYPQMVLFTPLITPDGVTISSPDGNSKSVGFADFLPTPAATEVWGNHFTALIAPDDINQWLSQFFPHPVQLRWVGEQLTRRVKRHDDVPLSFADGFPFLLTNSASLRDLQKRCSAGVRMTQFRPNLVVTGAEAWEEDSWQTVRIGEVIFDVAKPCGRCIFTTVSPAQGVKHPHKEPFKTLQRFRTAQDNGEIDFGQNLIARNSGIIQVGDKLDILATQTAKAYGAGEAIESIEPQTGPEKTVEITWQDSAFSGNNQHVLLEQLEQQGLRLPYSCRAGICGKCRIRLVEGSVKALTQSAMSNDGTILCCSCIPAGNIRLSPL